MERNKMKEKRKNKNTDAESVSKLLNGIELGYIDDWQLQLVTCRALNTLIEAHRPPSRSFISTNRRLTFIESTDGRRELVPGHKLLLSANSDVFQAMFNGSWKEHDQCEIVDASPAAFKEFLQFFYCSEIDVTAENVDMIMLLGHKYMVEECSGVCAQYLTDRLSNENVCAAYRLSLAIGQEDLKKLCEVSICVNAKDVFGTTGFLECDRKTLGTILKLDTLSCREVDIFAASMDWVKTVSKQTDLDKDTVLRHLGNDFYSIRFGATTSDELNFIFSSYPNLFTSEVRSEVVERIQTDNTKSVKRPRDFVWNMANVIECIRKTSSDDEKPLVIDSYESTTFVTNKPLVLRAVVCGKIMEWRKYKYAESIEEDVVGELAIYENRGPLGDDSFHMVYEKEITMSELLRLTLPIIIKPGISYRISLDIEDSDGYPFCTDFRIESKVVKVGGTKVVVKFVNEDKKMKQGRLIYGLHFNEI